VFIFPPIVAQKITFSPAKLWSGKIYRHTPANRSWSDEVYQRGIWRYIDARQIVPLGLMFRILCIRYKGIRVSVRAGRCEGILFKRFDTSVGSAILSYILRIKFKD